MKRLSLFFLLGATAVLCMGTIATVTVYRGAFYGTIVGLDNGITNSVGQTIDTRATNAATAVKNTFATGIAGLNTGITNSTGQTIAQLITAGTVAGVTGYSLKTNFISTPALVEQTNALGYVTNTYLTFVTNAYPYLGQ
jgi:hypothetical protein